MSYTPRTIAVIYAQLVAAKKANSSLSGLSSPSNVAYWNLWLWIVATAQNLLEQIWSILQIEIETTVASAAPETKNWIQAKVLAFQYDATTPQVVQVNTDLSVGYPVVDATLRIITNCAVIGGSGSLTIKAAPVVTAPQKAALISYLTEILGADISFAVINLAADTLDIFGTVYYNGQYAGSVVANVTAAVNTYLASIGFNGMVKVSDLIETIRNVTGVTDFVPLNIYATPSGGAATYLVNTNNIVSREYQSYSGQIGIDGGNPLSTSLTFSIDNA
jgi:hypothetical protein